MQVFASQLQSQGKDEADIKMSRYNGESNANIIMTSMSLQDRSAFMPSPRYASIEEESRRLEREKSFAALKWWDVYTESCNGSKKGYEREVMVRKDGDHSTFLEFFASVLTFFFFAGPSVRPSHQGGELHPGRLAGVRQRRSVRRPRH